MITIADEAARRFLCARLGLSGPIRPDASGLADLGMIQIDTIRIAGGRNHELAAAARAEVPIARFGEAVTGEGGFVEQHYPVHLVRREWRGLFAVGMAHRAERARGHGLGEEELASLEARVLDHIRAHGPARVRDFESVRVRGGFDTLKATTIALERLYCAGRVQIAGRTAAFERLFDLADRLHPDEPPPSVAPLADAEIAAQARAALEVLRIATPAALVDRVQHHLGPWRADARKERVRASTLAALEAIGAVPLDVLVAGERVPHLVLADDLEAVRAAAEGDAPARDEPLRILPPLDNLLFDRGRFARLFGRSFLFEAYKPKRERAFYFAMPLIHRARLVGIVDLRLVEGRILRVERYEPFVSGSPEWESPEALREALHRLARLVGARRVGAHARIDPSVRKAVIGPAV